jgi:hypothetical protein
MLHFLKNQIWRILIALATIFGILGFGLKELLSDNQVVWITFSIVLFTCLALLSISLFSLFRTIRKKYPTGYTVLSYNSSMTTNDGITLVYESTKHVQIKQAILNSIIQKTTWTGTKEPSISSGLQKIDTVTKDESGIRTIVSVFNKSRRYDEVETIHLKQVVDDSDKKSEPHIGMNVKESIQMISFAIRLLHVESNFKGKAYFERTPIGAHRSASSIQKIEEISFDHRTKTFEKVHLNPDSGFTYYLSWDRQ